ncbi:anaerobic ribonucleoside-triphosphate reductase activating protein [Candidatus Woesearchaeota archaeon]|nr:anaerobic ribonucleoside-triphosphate reductase activating protein [Candidatus Woesearchaeota archaeon]
MKIAGFLPETMIDWPGKIACEIFLAGCNYRCGFCHSPELVNGSAKQELEPEQFLDYLNQRRHMWTKPDGVVISGGEPTLNEGLPEYIMAIKALGYAVKLDTNGTNTPMLVELLAKKLVDYVAMDIKTSREKYDKATCKNNSLEGVVGSAEMLLSSDVDSEFRTTIVPGIVEMDDMWKISHWLSGGKRYSIQQFSPQNCLDPEYRKLRPYPKEALEEMARIAGGHFEKVNLKNIDSRASQPKHL